ncbi:MAG: protein-L-isoaspartate O-methyltransferase, partial [Betaproteobacteria bacterium]|nr:protein-L-isoaspartate O-methyltransferase [Betaproteobacteria bacterium]
IVGRRPIMQAQCLSKAASGATRLEILFETIAPALVGFGRPSHFSL